MRGPGFITLDTGGKDAPPCPQSFEDMDEPDKELFLHFNNLFGDLLYSIGCSVLHDPVKILLFLEFCSKLLVPMRVQHEELFHAYIRSLEHPELLKKAERRVEAAKEAMKRNG